jgi:CTD nuclear envelope phosphatase 1
MSVWLITLRSAITIMKVRRFYAPDVHEALRYPLTANGIPIEGWTHDPHDEALLELLPVLDSLRFTGDVRRVLGIRGFS